MALAPPGGQSSANVRVPADPQNRVRDWRLAGSRCSGHPGSAVEAIVLVVVLLLVGAAVVAWRRRSQPSGRTIAPPAPSPTRPQATGPLPGPQATIALDVVVADPGNPAVQRLVRDAASRVLRISPDVEAVIVEDRAGMRLGTVERDQGLVGEIPVATEVPKPDRRRSRRTPGSRGEPGTAARAGDQDVAPHRSLADRFELPDTVRAHLRRPDDPVDVVRAILEAAKLPVQVHGNVILSGDEAVIVVSETGGSTSQALTDAFLRFQKSGAARGVVITLGYMGGRDIERRQALAPNLRYTGLSAIQRMADAVALGANPLMFTTDPAILE